MSTTVLDILNDVAFRLGEDGNPDDVAEQKRRLSYLNQVYRQVVRKRYWWFTEAEYSLQTVENQDIYDLPSDYRETIEVRIDGKRVEPTATFQALGSYDKPVDTYISNLDKQYYIFNNKLYLIPEARTEPSAISVTGIVVSGTTATVTTAVAHGLEIDDYVTIAGTSTTDFDTSHQIKSVPSTTTFTIEVASGTADPSGTITVTHNNFVIKYYKSPTKLTALTDTIIIPEIFSDVLSSYVFGRISQVDGERGDAADGFDEHNGIIEEMVIENNKRNSWGKAVRPL